MKLSTSLALAATVVYSTNAFVPINRPNRAAFASSRIIAMSSDNAENDAVVAESVIPEGDAYARLGVPEDEVALGIDPTEFLQWIGSKKDLMEKFQRDNKGMDEERADAEVSKFLMDAEMVNSYIKFERDKIENPPDYKAEAEQTLSDPKTIATYAAWLIGGGSFGYIRKEIIEPKYASGEWEEIRIAIPNWFPVGGGEAAEAANSVASAADAIDASAAADAVHTTLGMM